MPDLPAQPRPWPDDATFAAESASTPTRVGSPFGVAMRSIGDAKRSSRKLIEMYANGYAGARYNPEAKERFLERCEASGGFRHFADVAHAKGFADSFAGQLVVPYIWQLVFWPGCLPGAAQERGDCVSHAASGAQRLTIAGDIASMMPDEASKKLEWIPKVDPVGIKNGVTSSEYQYWWRGYNGDGWDCPTAGEVSLTRGALLRNSYDGVIDVRDYSSSLAGKYGSKSPPDSILNLAVGHTLHTAAEASTIEEIRDALGSLRGVQTCGGQGFSGTRDQYGYSAQSGSWSHGFKVIGVDDRTETKSIKGEPWILCDNNWGIWNSGPRDIRDSKSMVPGISKLIDKVSGRHVDLIAIDVVNASTGNLMIPPGSWWTKWSSMKNRDYTVYAGIKGWDRPMLPNWGGSLAG